MTRTVRSPATPTTNTRRMSNWSRIWDSRRTDSVSLGRGSCHLVNHLQPRDIKKPRVTILMNTWLKKNTCYNSQVYVTSTTTCFLFNRRRRGEPRRSGLLPESRPRTEGRRHQAFGDFISLGYAASPSRFRRYAHLPSVWKTIWSFFKFFPRLGQPGFRLLVRGVRQGRVTGFSDFCHQILCNSYQI